MLHRVTPADVQATIDGHDLLILVRRLSPRLSRESTSSKIDYR